MYRVKGVFIVLSFATGLLQFAGCARFVPENSREIVASVGDNVLYQKEVASIVPDGTAEKDSMDMARDYVRRWVTDAILYENAKRNVNNTSEIDDMVERYRRSLTIYHYQQDYIAERMPDISDDEVYDFYRADSTRFILEDVIMRGVMISVPIGVSGLDELSRRMKRLESEDVEYIEKFSYKNAVSYDYFVDRWVDYRTLRNKMPLPAKPAIMANKTDLYEVQDSMFVYLLHVSEYRLEGTPAPFEYVSSKVKELLYSKKKKDFIMDFEHNLYDDAVRSGRVKFGKTGK